MKKIVLSIVIASALTACAKIPSAIPAIKVASSEYSGQSCSQLTAEYIRVSAMLEEVEQKQRKKVADDAAGVYLLVIPPSVLVGDYAADVGRYKGEKIAVKRAMQSRGCI